MGFFINHHDNVPGTTFCDNVDRLIEVQTDLCESKANGDIEEQLPALHLRGVVGSALDTEFLQALNDLIDRKIGNEPTKERF